MSRDIVKHPVTRQEAAETLVKVARHMFASPEFSPLAAWIVGQAAGLCLFAPEGMFNIAFNGDPLAHDLTKR